MRLLLLALVLTTNRLASASDAVAAAPSSFSWSALAGVTYGTVTNTNTGARFLFTGGAEGHYALSPSFGLFLGTKLLGRGFEVAGLTSSATFLDVTLGVTFDPRSGLWCDSARTKFFLAPIIAIPLGDFSGALPLSFGNTSKMDVGVLLAFQQQWTLGGDLFLGYRLWGARGFSGIVRGAGARLSFGEVGLALVGSFR